MNRILKYIRRNFIGLFLAAPRMMTKAFKLFSYDKRRSTSQSTVIYHSDRDTCFNVRYGRSFQEALGIKPNFSIAFHSQTDGQSERIVQIRQELREESTFGRVRLQQQLSVQQKDAPFEAHYGRPCRSPICWLGAEDRFFTAPDDILYNNQKIPIIQERLRTAQNRQQSYADRCCRPLEFEEGDYVLLRVSPRKGNMCFEIKGKLTPRYIGLFQIVQRVGVVTNHFALLPELSHMHNMFHDSMLRKYRYDPNAVLQWYNVPIQEDMSYEEALFRILIEKMKSLCHCVIPLVKVL